MVGRTPFALLLLGLLSLVAGVFAAAPTEFCKCTCFNANSTIIPLDDVPAPEPPEPPSEEKEEDSNDDSSSRRHLSARNLLGLRSPNVAIATCNDCTKRFCLDQDLSICKDATEDDVVTTCFQRDSAKDEAVVLIFIFATVGLLAYAALRPWVDQWATNVRERHTYIPVSEGGR